MYLRFRNRRAGRYENRVPQSVKAPGLPKLCWAGSIRNYLIHRGLDNWGYGGITVLSNISTPDLTDVEGNDIFAEAFWLVPTSDETYPERSRFPVVDFQ
jgi:hypothetical protein